MKNKLPRWAISMVLGTVVVLGLATIGRSGNLEPPAPPSSTMHTLEDIYQAVQADTQFQFLGTTAAVTSDIGYFGMTRECQAQFGAGTRLCTTVEIIETVVLPDLTAWQSDQAWVQPVVVGIAGSRRFDGTSVFSVLEATGRNTWDEGQGHNDFSCDGYLYSGLGRQGLIISKGSGFEAGISGTDCAQIAGVACCGPIP